MIIKMLHAKFYAFSYYYGRFRYLYLICRGFTLHRDDLKAGTHESPHDTLKRYR